MTMDRAGDVIWLTGAMILVGMGDGNECHHPSYIFNDNILGHGASYWVRLVETFLS